MSIREYESQTHVVMSRLEYKEMQVQAASWQNICRMTGMPFTSAALTVYAAIEAVTREAAKDE